MIFVCNSVPEDRVSMGNYQPMFFELKDAAAAVERWPLASSSILSSKAISIAHFHSIATIQI